VPNYQSNIRIILGRLTPETGMNSINFEEGQLLKSLQVTLVFQPSVKLGSELSSDVGTVFSKYFHTS